MKELLEILTVLLSWASHLSGYPMAELPEVRFEQHEFFVERACGVRPYYHSWGWQELRAVKRPSCPVVGWYNDQGIVYIDERFRDINGGFASSLVVHEFTHYLQDPDMDPCARELQAYSVQNDYIGKVLTTNYRARASCSLGASE